MAHVSYTRTLPLLAALLASASLGTAARAVAPPEDRLTVMGDTLRGRVVGLTTEAVEFRTVYGDGDIRIPYEAVENLETEGEYRVVYGDGEETSGRVLGVRGETVLVGAAPDSAVAVPVASIRGVALKERFEESFLTRLRARYPHWSAEFDVGFNFETGAVDKDKVRTRLLLERRLAPARLLMEVDYALDIQQKRDGPRVQTKNELFSQIRYEHDLGWRQLFALGAMGYEFDDPRKIDARIFPNAGLGYRILQREESFVSLLAGFGFVYEEFDGFPNNDYGAAMLGIEAEWQLPYDISLRSGVFYMPSLSDFENDWLFRWNFEITVPIWDPIAMRFRMRNTNDSNPAPDVGNNKFTTIMGLTLQF